MISIRSLWIIACGLALLALAAVGALRAQDGVSSAVPDQADDAVLAPEPAPGERVSADNNISFPVDI